MTTLEPTLTASTIPSWSPLFDPFPHSFRGLTRVTTLVRTEPGVTARLVPAPFEAVGDVLFVNWLRVGDVQGYQGTHNISINVPVRFEDRTGKYCSLEYIDIDMGVAAGREALAYPKKEAEFVWEQTGSRLHLECRRFGEVLITADVDIDDSGSGDDIDWVRDFAAPVLGGDSLLVRYLAEDYGVPPAVAQVERVVFSDFRSWDARSASSTLNVSATARDRLDLLGDLEVLAARVDEQEFDLHVNQVIARRPLG